MKTNTKYLIALGIIVIAALFFIKDNFKSKKPQNYNTQNEYLKTKEDILRINKSKIDSLTILINTCISKVKYTKAKHIENETEVILDCLIYLRQKEKDSINRLNANNDIVNKTQENNTLKLSLYKDSQFFNLDNHIQFQMMTTVDNNKFKKNNVTNRYESLIEQFLNTDYLVIINTTKKLAPEVIDNKNFKSGYIVATLYYFDLKKTKIIKTATMVVENSPKVYFTEINEIGIRINNNDLNTNLNQNFREEINLVLFGKGDSYPTN